jgi:hypothetical protein
MILVNHNRDIGKSMTKANGGKGVRKREPPSTHRGWHTRPGVAVFSEVWLPTATIRNKVRMSSLRTERWKFIKNWTLDEEQLFDLENDPANATTFWKASPSKRSIGKRFWRLGSI